MTIAHKLYKKGFTRDIYKAAALVMNGVVYINKQICENPLTELKPGDLVMIGRNKVFVFGEQDECL